MTEEVMKTAVEFAEPTASKKLKGRTDDVTNPRGWFQEVPWSPRHTLRRRGGVGVRGEGVGAAAEEAPGGELPQGRRPVPRGRRGMPELPGGGEWAAAVREPGATYVFSQ